MGSVASCCNKELSEKDVNAGPDATALTDLVDRRSTQDGSNVLQRPVTASHGSHGILWDDDLGLIDMLREEKRVEGKVPTSHYAARHCISLFNASSGRDGACAQ